MIDFHNPSSIQQPLGPYSQGIVYSGKQRCLQTSGQTPTHPDGSIPESFEAQATLVWERIVAVLNDAGMSARDIVTVRSYLTDRANVSAYSAIKKRFLETARPASTGVIVPGLFNERYLLEVEVTALRDLPDNDAA